MIKLQRLAVLGLMVSTLLSVSCLALNQTPSPKGAEVYIISPQDGDIVSQDVHVQFGLKNMGIAPAGVRRPRTGHHHLLVDHKGMPRMDRVLPGSKNLIHFGGGQTETTLKLTPGKHTLQLILGDMNHIPHLPPVISRKITITVK